MSEPHPELREVAERAFEDAMRAKAIRPRQVDRAARQFLIDSVLTEDASKAFSLGELGPDVVADYVRGVLSRAIDEQGYRRGTRRSTTIGVDAMSFSKEGFCENFKIPWFCKCKKH